MSVRSNLSAIRRKVLCSVYKRTLRLQNQEPIVSFTFDDFPRSAYLVGGKILEEFGARGTYYTAFGLVGTTNESGEQFLLDDLHSMHEKGHEVGSHTFSHISCRAVPTSVFEKDVEKGREAIRKVTGSEEVNFAYPFGHVTLNAKRSLGPKVMSSARSIFAGLNGVKTDTNLLRANSLYGDLEQSKRVEDLIRQNVEQKGWLIFYTHDVQLRPSKFGCTPSLLESVVSSAVRSGYKISTIREALRGVGVEDKYSEGLVCESNSA